MQEVDLLRIHRETQKYLEIDNIFNRLQSTYIQKLYAMFNGIFQSEHEYTVQELLKLAIQKEIPLKEFKLAEHYRLNSHIFKSNLQLIINVIVEDIWVSFNKLIVTEEVKLIEPRLLTQIDEESQIDFRPSELLTEYSSEWKDKPKITPRNEYRNCQSSRIPLQKLLSADKYQNFTSINSSPRMSKENSQTTMKVKQTQQSLQTSKKKNASIIKNKSMDLKGLTEGLLNAGKIQSPRNQMINLQGMIQKMQFQCGIIPGGSIK